MGCRGICEKYITGGHSYNGRNSRCISCNPNNFLNLTCDVCPCCHWRLRSRPRKPYRKKIPQKILISNGIMV